ncbi:hypothetical protein [Pseudomonas prosekii]|uniref:hypothetical protein n=1 Tax=Pseudomonas prosekii TaxID=1148509 RepID=UPI00165687A4
MIAEPTLTFEIPKCGGDHRIRCCPHNASTDPLKIGHQVDVLVRHKMLKAAGFSIGFGTHTEIGAVDVAMVLDELVQLEIPGTKPVIMFISANHLYRPTYRVSLKLGLASEPVMRNDRVGNGERKPLRTDAQQFLRASRPSLPHFLKRDIERCYALGRNQLPSVVGAIVEDD